MTATVPSTLDGGFAALIAELDARRRERDEKMKTFWATTPEQRREAMWRGELSFAQCGVWAARAPHEVPLIDGEWAFIVMHTPEWAEAASATSDERARVQAITSAALSTRRRSTQVPAAAVLLPA